MHMARRIFVFLLALCSLSPCPSADGANSHYRDLSRSRGLDIHFLHEASLIMLFTLSFCPMSAPERDIQQYPTSTLSAFYHISHSDRIPLGAFDIRTRTLGLSRAQSIQSTAHISVITLCVLIILSALRHPGRRSTRGLSALVYFISSVFFFSLILVFRDFRAGQKRLGIGTGGE